MIATDGLFHTIFQDTEAYGKVYRMEFVRQSHQVKIRLLKRSAVKIDVYTG